jgi:hypothetical protein
MTAQPHEPWTIDRVTHALPLPDLRQDFLREVHLAPVDDVPDVVARWVSLIEDYEKGRPEVEAIRAYFLEHGELPPEHQPTPESDATFAAWESQMAEAQRTRGAA